MKRRLHSGLLICLLICLLTVSLSGCGKVVIQAGKGNNEIFTAGTKIGRDYELKIYLTLMQKAYEAKLGQQVYEDEQTAEVIKENALALLTRIKVLCQMAQDKGVELNDLETSGTLQMAEEYYSSLSDAQKEYFGADREQIAAMYADYALAEKMYGEILSSADTEVSDDEARSVQIQCITILTYRLSDTGERVEFTADEKAQAKERAEAIHQEIMDGIANLTGVTFDEYISKYNEEGNGNYTIGRGEVDEAFEEAAFNTPVGSISDVVQTKDGYRIIKGISTFDQSEIDSNKEKIAREREQAKFQKQYDSYAETLNIKMDEDAWNNIKMTNDPQIDGGSFYEIYERFSNK